MSMRGNEPEVIIPSTWLRRPEDYTPPTPPTRLEDHGRLALHQHRGRRTVSRLRVDLRAGTLDASRSSFDSEHFRFTATRRLPVLLAAIAITALLLLVWHSPPARAKGDANSPSCENESSPGFRTTLPDCRAYELVSPAYGAGAIAAGPNRKPPPIAADGEQILAESFGEFAEAEELAQDGTEYGDIFEFSRTPTGWSAEAQDPPAWLYPWHIIEPNEPTYHDEPALATDLGSSVWFVPGALSPGEEPERNWLQHERGLLVLREGKDRFAVLGRVFAPGALRGVAEYPLFRGVSADASHVFFAARGHGRSLWPGDPTLESEVVRRESVYEYHGSGGGEPVLVGVSNEGPPPWEPGAAHLNEGADLESDCGTEMLGMSSDGETVFFTAQHEDGCTAPQPSATELYARVGGEHTVDISEPDSQDCAACVTSGLRFPASFDGASEDGARVFFSSEQKLFAGVHGEAGMNLYEYDFGGAPGDRVTFIAHEVSSIPELGGETLQSQHLALVAKDGARVYFQSPVALTGGANANGESAAEDLEAGDSTLLYVYDTGSKGLAFVAGARPNEATEPPPFNNSEREPFKRFDATSDGEFLVFETATDLRGTDDTSTVPQVFEYDAVSGALARVSQGQRSPAGFLCSSTSTVEENYDCDGNTTNHKDGARTVQGGLNSVAVDGTVVFTSPLPLAPGAVLTNSAANAGAEGAENVYEYRDGQVYLISAGDEPTSVHFQSSEQTRLLGIDQSGRDVFFISGDALVPQDTDTQASWYAARLGGGFPGPLAVGGCVGEACQGGSGGAPVLAAGLPSRGGEAPVFSPGAPVVSRAVVLTRAQRLAKALRTCRREKAKKKRVVCEKRARKAYGAKTARVSRASGGGSLMRRSAGVGSGVPVPVR